MSKKPIDILLDRVKFGCTVCGAAMGTCTCWTKCACGWLYRNLPGVMCNNPVHDRATRKAKTP